jgi:hypothetical protein
VGDASYLQADFLGGEWSSYYQGRFTDPEYRRAMSVCLNAVPLEEGAVTRRPGSRFIAFTKGGAPAALWRFGFTSSAPYNLEFTPGFLRLSYGPSLVLEPTAQSVVSFTTPPLWNSATTYAADAVVVTNLGFVYFSIAGANTDNDPTADIGGANWTLVGPSSCLVTTGGAHGFQGGNEVEFFLPTGDLTDFGTVTLLNRQFIIEVAGPDAFLIFDSVTGAPVDATTLTLGVNGMQVACVLMFSTPYLEAELPQIRVVQSIDNETNQLFVLHPNHQPLVLEATQSPDPAFNSFGTFTFGPATFLDGPYLDPPASGASLTPTGLSGVVTLDITIVEWDIGTTYGIGDVVSFDGIGYTSLIDSNVGNEPDTSGLDWQAQSIGADVGPAGFVTTDVGRSIRLFSEPANWSDATDYVTGDIVKFDGSYWSALQNNNDTQPGLDVVNWAVDPTGAVWTWGRIQAVNSASEVTLQLLGGDLLYSLPVQTWQMGRYSDTTGWPANGTYDDGGRLWIVGLQGNHFDASVSNQTLVFSPTGQDGTVADNNAIAETLNDKEVDAIFWLMLSHGGIVMGTQGGEWLVQASALNEPITPTSVQARKVTKYGMENIQPEHAPLAFLAVQRYSRKLLEYIADPYTGKYSATNIGIRGAQIIQNGGGIAKIAYQQERTPVMWAQLNDGSLAGMTYRRDSPFGTQPATFAAWHRHTLGSGNAVVSISGGAAAGGEVDCLTMITQNPTTGICQLELLTDFFDEDQDITDAWYLDAADLPALIQLNPAGLSGVRLYGYHYLAGQTVDVWAAGLDMGSLSVATDGHIDVPFGSDPNGLFTLSRLQMLTTDYQSLFPDLAVFIFNGSAAPPVEPPNTAGITEFLPTVGTISVPAIDWSTGTFFCNTNSFKYAQYNIQTRALVSIFPSPGLGYSGSSGIVGSDGNIYGIDGVVSLSNTNPFFKFEVNYQRLIPVFTPGLYIPGNNGFSTEDTSTFGPSIFNFSFGEAGSSLTSAAGGICAPRSVAAVSAGNQYIVQTNLVGAFNNTLQAQVTLIDGTEMKWLTNFAGIYNCANVVTGRQISQGNGIFYGEVFSLISNVNEFETITGNPIVLYKLSITTSMSGDKSVPAFVWEQIADIQPAQIDPTWSGFTVTQGIAWDSTDNNILAFAQTTGATNNCYLYKINSLTGAVMWAIPMPGCPVEDILWPQSLIEGGRLALFIETGLSSSNLYWIDTLGGTIISTTEVNGLVDFGSQAYGPLGLLLYHGDYTDSAGTPVPIAPATSAGFTNGTGMFLGLPATPPSPLALPIIAGYTYTTQTQILRPVAPQEAGAQNGPALGKTRRTHMAAYLFHGTGQGVQFGTDFAASLHQCNFMLNADSVTPMPITSLYSDIYWDSIEDDYSFNGRPALQVTRPYPMSCLAIEAFLRTQDR